MKIYFSAVILGNWLQIFLSFRGQNGIFNPDGLLLSLGIPEMLHFCGLSVHLWMRDANKGFNHTKTFV